MSPLPQCRVAPGRPAFTCVGVNFAGSFLTRNGSVTKRYQCVFTCLAIRAVHLEVVFSLETDAFYRHFVNLPVDALCLKLCIETAVVTLLELSVRCAASDAMLDE